MTKELEALSDSDIYPFHMPGHKRQPAGGVLDEVSRLDITEIDGFDDLQAPGGLIKEIETRLAEHYGADSAHLSVNGSTCGILASISAAVGHREGLLMDRGSHQSAFNCVYIGELRSHYLKREIIPEYSISGCVAADTVESELKALEEKGQLPQAVFITSPTYEGFIADTGRIAETVHAYGIPLIVDGAHGAHLPIEKEADITIVSLHKTLPALTQLAAVLVRGERVDDDRVKRFINIYQTSSPSYILMASAEGCLDLLEHEGEARREHLMRELDGIYDMKSRLKRLDIIGPEYVGRYGIHGYDRSKINLTDRTGVLDGQGIYDRLRQRYHLQPEMCMGRDCLLMTSIMDTEEGFTRLKKAILDIDGSL